MSRASEFRLAPAHRQRGAAAIFGAVSILLGLLCVGLTIDLGRYYLAQRDLQRIANVAALDAARVAGGCIGSIPNAQTAAQQEVINSVLRNGGQAAWVGQGVRIGTLEGHKAVRYFVPGLNDKNRAVEVLLTRDAPGRLIPLLGGGDGPAQIDARSAAYSTPSATVKMGTKLLAVDTSRQAQLNRLFTSLLGAPINLSVLTYQSLLNAQVPVSGLLDRLDVGTPQELLETVTQRALLQALVDELNALGYTSAAAGAQVLRDAASTTDLLLPGQVLGINDPVTPVLLSASDIVMALAQAGASGELLNVPVGLPAPLNGVLQLSLVQAALPTFLVPGGVDLFPENFASNTQVLARTTSPTTLSLALPLGLANANLALNLPLFVQAGKGTAEIDHLSCARRGQIQDLAYVRAQTGILNVGIGNFSDINAPNPTPSSAEILRTVITVRLLGLYDINIQLVAHAYASVPLASTNSILEEPFVQGETRHLGTPRVSQITGSISANNIQVTVEPPVVLNPLPLVSGLVNTVLAVITSTLGPLIQSQIVAQLGSLADQSVLPLLDAAGVTVGGADVTVIAIDAQQPYLFTH